ncbi:MAG TPA: hypothetical protein VK911_08505, partial [Vicinamibacterales bacterium]|nr:hypothetical protein [Vicinamibacterales bacterium]
MPEPPDPSVAAIRFAPFELDVGTGELRREGAAVPLPEVARRMLLLLLEGQGRPVPGDALAARLGANSASLDVGSAFSCLQEVLGDEDPGNPRFIASSPDGYRFVAAASAAASPPHGSKAGIEWADEMKPLPEEGGRYVLHELIGAGGMGEVFRGRDLRLQRDVAIKFLPPWLANDALGLCRFHREARAAASLNHPN